MAAACICAVAASCSPCCAVLLSHFVPVALLGTGRLPTGNMNSNNFSAILAVLQGASMSIDAAAALPGTNYAFDGKGTLVNVNTGAGFAFTTQTVRPPFNLIYPSSSF